MAQLSPGAGHLDAASLKAVAAAAVKLFPESKGATPVVSAVKYVERYVDGFEYQVFETTLPDGKKLGRFTRVLVHPDARSRLDFAVRIDQDRITAFEPVFPILVNGKPFKELPLIFQTVGSLPVPAYAQPLEKFFGALRLVSKADAAPPPPYKPVPGAQPILSVESRRLALGQPMPGFELQDLTGATVSSTGWKGRPAIVAFGELKEEASRVLLKTVERFAETVPETNVLKVLLDSAQQKDDLISLEREPEVLLRRAALDPDRKLATLFQVPLTPYVYVFDRQGKVAYSASWPGADKLRSELAETFEKLLKRKLGGEPGGQK